MARFTLFTLAVGMQSASAFAPSALPRHQTALNLVPEQGRQLVAFSQDYLAKKAKESASKSSHLTRSPTPSRGIAGAARSLVTRLVGHGENKSSVRGDTALELAASGYEQEVSTVHQHSEDEVLYPIVGFHLVEGHALGTPGQVAACNLHSFSEEFVGSWSSPQDDESLWM